MMLNHPKTLQKIDEVFVFIASDANGEGVPAFQSGSGKLPSTTTIMELAEWSYQQTIEPQTEPTGNVMDIAKQN